jgi:hypothetical protein
MSAALLIDIILWGSVAAVGFIAYQRGPKVLTTSLREGTMDFINIVPRIALGVIGSGYIAAVIPQEIITGWLGPNSGWLGRTSFFRIDKALSPLLFVESGSGFTGYDLD